MRGWCRVPLGKASLARYPQFVADVEEISGRRAGFRPKGTLEALFAGDAPEELSTLVALHRGMGLACEPLRVEEARELEPALSEDVQATALRPEEASVDNRALTRAVLSGDGEGPAAWAVVLSAGLRVHVAGLASSPERGAAMASAAVTDGRGLAALDALVG